MWIDIDWPIRKKVNDWYGDQQSFIIGSPVGPTINGQTVRRLNKEPYWEENLK